MSGGIVAYGGASNADHLNPNPLPETGAEFLTGVFSERIIVQFVRQETPCLEKVFPRISGRVCAMSYNDWEEERRQRAEAERRAEEERQARERAAWADQQRRAEEDRRIREYHQQQNHSGWWVG